MTNEVIIEIAIGLTFIFVLYSLLATTINEFLASIFAYRHRMLERGLEQMLDGKNYSYYWWDKLLNAFLWLSYIINYFPSCKKSKRISPAGRRNAFKRKNISKNFFSKEKLYNPVIIRNGKKQYAYKRVVLNEKAALFTAKITDHPLYRRKSEDSILIKKPAYLGAPAFSDILIDVLGNKPKSSIAPTLMKDIAHYVNNMSDNPDLKKILRLYIEQANGDLINFKAILEDWYNDTMDRVSGWYKRQSNYILLAIGFLLAIIFNVSTLDIVITLSTNEPARKALANNATEYVKTQSQNRSNDISDALNDSSKKNLQFVNELYKKDILSNNSVIGLGWGDYGYSKHLAKDCKTKKPGIFEKIGYVLIQTFTNWKKIIGFLITAFAISLGAPFWFDLLNKFVNLRVSGTKPNEQTSSTVIQATSTTKKPDPTAKG